MAVELKVPSMACSACVETIALALRNVDPTAQVEADTKTKMVRVETQQPETAVRRVLAEAGYPVA